MLRVGTLERANADFVMKTRLEATDLYLNNEVSAID